MPIRFASPIGARLSLPPEFPDAPDLIDGPVVGDFCIALRAIDVIMSNALESTNNPLLRFESDVEKCCRVVQVDRSL